MKLGWHHPILLVAAHAIAWNVTRTWGMYVIVFVVSLLGLAGISLAVLKAIGTATDRSLAEATRSLDAIQRLSITEARERAERLLANPKHFRCTPSESGATQELKGLGPEAHTFFERYQRVQADLEGIELNRDQIGPSSLNPAYLRIGTGTADTDVVIRPGQDEVYVIDGSEQDLADAEAYPSVYHWLLAMADGTEVGVVRST